MKDLNSWIEDYRSADAHRRLCLYLEVPPLREEFMEIEQAESAWDGGRRARKGVVGTAVGIVLSLFKGTC